jgi:hypothetical protein
MQSIKQVLRPDWRKALLFAIFTLTAVGGHVQSWAFSDVPPKPPLYDLLRPFPIWPIWVFLLMPLGLLSLPLRIIGLDIMSGHFWLFVAAQALCFYLLSCLLVVSFDGYRNRFPRWPWAAIVIAPLALHLLGLIAAILFGQPPLPLTPGERIQMMLRFFPTSPAGSLDPFLPACLGFFIYDVLRKAGALEEDEAQLNRNKHPAQHESSGRPDARVAGAL